MQYTYEGDIVPQSWAKPARKRITALSKGIAEILAALAEPAMRYATVYLALATSIAAINVPWLYDIAKGIVISAPEFVILGALAIAEDAWRSGRRFWPFMLFVICALLAGIMITTFFDIFIVKFYDWAIAWLNFARCLTAVGFSVVLNKLDDERPRDTTAIPASPQQPATSPNALPVAPYDGVATQHGNSKESDSDNEESSDMPALPRTGDSYGDDKLAATLTFLRRHPGADDEELAVHLGLESPARARFWRLKAGALLAASAQEAQPHTDPAMPAQVAPQRHATAKRDSEQAATGGATQSDPRHGVHLVAPPPRDTATTTKQDRDSKQAATGDTATRINQYRIAHTDATTKDVADALGISQRTVQRHWSPVPLVAVHYSL